MFILNRKKHLGGGTVLDLGVYTTQFCQFIFQEEPKSIKATGKLNDEGIDLEMTAELRYSGNKVAKMRTSALTTYENVGKIVGTKGTMQVSKRQLIFFSSTKTAVYLKCDLFVSNRTC